MEHRFRQVAEIEDDQDRFEGYAQTITAAFLQPNFTQFGFGLARAPDELMQALRQGIQDGLEAGPRLEGDIPVIHGDFPWFIDRPDLTQRVSCFNITKLWYFHLSFVSSSSSLCSKMIIRYYRNFNIILKLGQAWN